MLPYILSEIRDLSSEEPRRYVAPAQGYGGHFDDLIDELLLYRPSLVARPAARTSSHRPGLLRLIDAERAEPQQPRTLQRRQSHPGRPSLLQQLKRELAELPRLDKGAFAFNVDVQDYRPEELSVQVTKDDGFVVVEGSHEERADEHGLVRRQFTRRYKIPDGVDPDTITSRLTPDGVLQVSAPVKALNAPKDRVRQVPISCGKQPTQQQQHAEEADEAHAEEKQADDAEAQNES